MSVLPLQSPSVFKGIMLMLLAMFCSASMNTIIRILAEHMPSAQMVFIRNVISLVLILLWIIGRKQGRNVLATDKPKAHVWRATIGFMAMELWFYGLSVMPLTLATALSFTTPLFSAIFAVMILKEKAGWRRVCAILAGFVGVLIIIRPDTGALSFSAGIVLLSSGLMGLSGVVVKSLTRTESPETIVLYMSLFMTPLSLPLALYVWQPVSMQATFMVGLIALLSTIMHLLLTRAYRHAEMVVLLPFDFTRLIYTAIFAYALFGEKLDAHTMLGAGVIMLSSIYIVHREALKRKPKLGEMVVEPGEV